MKYDHTVKHNGIYYPAGADVPNEVMTIEPEPLPLEDIVVPEKAPVKRGRKKKE